MSKIIEAKRGPRTRGHLRVLASNVIDLAQVRAARAAGVLDPVIFGRTAFGDIVISKTAFDQTQTGRTVGALEHSAGITSIRRKKRPVITPQREESQSDLQVVEAVQKIEASLTREQRQAVEDQGINIARLIKRLGQAAAIALVLNAGMVAHDAGQNSTDTAEASPDDQRPPAIPPHGPPPMPGAGPQLNIPRLPGPPGGAVFPHPPTTLPPQVQPPVVQPPTFQPPGLPPLPIAPPPFVPFAPPPPPPPPGFLPPPPPPAEFRPPPPRVEVLPVRGPQGPQGPRGEQGQPGPAAPAAPINVEQTTDVDVTVIQKPVQTVKLQPPAEVFVPIPVAVPAETVVPPPAPAAPVQVRYSQPAPAPRVGKAQLPAAGVEDIFTKDFATATGFAAMGLVATAAMPLLSRRRRKEKPSIQLQQAMQAKVVREKSSLLPKGVIFKPARMPSPQRQSFDGIIHLGTIRLAPLAA